MMCHASYDRRSGPRQTELTIRTISAASAAIPNHTSAGAATALAGVTSSQCAEMPKWMRMNARPA